MKKTTFYTLICFVILICTIIGIKFTQKEKLNIEKPKMSQTAKKKKEIAQLKYSIIEIPTNDFFSKSEYSKIIKISMSDFTNIIINLDENPVWYNEKIINIVGSTLFANKKSIILTNFIEKVIEGKLRKDNKTVAPFPDNLPSNRFYGDVLIAMRYRKLLPYMANKILEDSNNTNKEKEIKFRISWLPYIEHPDTLRLILELDKKIPEDSYLRKNTRICNLPFFYRKDCLDVYIEIADQPENYDYYKWNSAARHIGWFTNDIAISAFDRAYKIMKNYKKYWPELPSSMQLEIICMKTQMKTRQRIIDGQRPPRKQPKPLLDE